MMYELLTGRDPFLTDSFSRLVNILLNEEPPLMSDFRSDVPEVLEQIVRKAKEYRRSLSDGSGVCHRFKSCF
jgi:serine/threonine protein kinase